MFKNVKIALALCAAFFLLCCSFDKPEEASLCGNKLYNNETEFCFYDVVYANCDGWRTYNPETQKCDNDIILIKCGNDYYNERMAFCYDDKIYANCGWDKYNPETQKCDNATVLTECGKDYYNEITEFCYDNAVYKKCNGAIYDLAKQKCAENDSLLNICKDIPYEPYSQYCVNSNVVAKEIFKDSRDGREYKTVVIGDLTWMAENLNYNAESSRCYRDEPAGCDKYGRLYNWETAINACPNGWHLPSDEEWEKLVPSNDEGEKLKSASGWRCIGEYGILSDYFDEWYDEWDDLISTWSRGGSCIRPGNGSDEFGFSALPGGVISHKGSSGYSYEYGFWWSSTNKDSTASYLSLVYFSKYLSGLEANKLHSLSVRCVKD